MVTHAFPNQSVTLRQVPVRIQTFEKEHVAAVREFNLRLQGKAFPFPAGPVPDWLPPAPGLRIYQEQFLALDDGVVRGGYLLKRQDFSFGGEVATVGYYHSALSEGIVDNRYAMVGIQLLSDALKREPLLYALGMGGLDRPLPRMLRSMGWSLSVVPFHFRVVHPNRFLRQIGPLRQTAARRIACDAASFTGAGWAAVHAFQFLRAGRRAAGQASVELVDRFAAWADPLWQECRPRYPFIAVRDSETLAILYPGPPFLRLKISSAGKIIGWAVALDTAMRQDPYFGGMRLGSLVDFLALPEHAFTVVSAARQFLRERGVDLMVCNQGHREWCGALHEAGFLRGPSNFIFGASKALTCKLAASGVEADGLFLMRGDGDGPIHL